MRGKKATKRVLASDPKFGSETIAKLTNYIMKDGKKNTAQAIVYRAFEIVEAKAKQDPMQIFEDALRNVMPQVEVRSRRVGGANYQVPVEVRGERKTSLAFRWILGAVRGRKGKPTAEKLAEELIAAAAGEGAAVKKRDDVHRMAEANRAFAHFG